MTSNELFRGAKWIECTGNDAPLFRKEFNAVKGEKAEITICGLGYFHLYINGKKVSDDLLTPNATNYSERDLNLLNFPLSSDFSYRIYAVRYDITDYLLDGKNTLAVMLGNGYYNQNKRMAEGNVVFGTPKLCYVIEKESGDILCDETTLTRKGYILENNLYMGEYHDYSQYPEGFDKNGYCGGDFSESTVIPAPESNFQIQFSPSDKAVRTLKPKLIKDEGKTKLYEVSENTVGYAVFKCCEKGKKIVVSYAEEIYDERPYYGVKFAENYQTDTFITDGSDREYIPEFTWHGFRYFRVEGDVEPIRVDVVHSDCPVISSFESDNENLNWLYDAYIKTQLCNMHSGVPSDCPHRERLGYTGDGQLCCEAGMMLLDSREFYRKWLYDIADCQCRNSGHVPHTAPWMGGGGGPSGWGGAIIEVPYKFYKVYGDKDLLNEFFPKMLHFLDYLESRSENGFVYREEEPGWCLGDWCAPEKIRIPEVYVNTCLYVRFMQQTVEAAQILGRESEAAHLNERIEKVKRAITVAYYSFHQNTFCGDVQGASCLALRIGLGDEGVKQEVFNKYEKLGMFDSGIIVTEALPGYLFENGKGQIAFNLLSSDKDVSFAYMRKNGATTIWENWSGADSRNHPMFGSVTKYLFTYLLGIRQPENGAGYKDVVITPCFVEGMDRAKGHLETASGVVSVDYVKNGGKATVKVYADPKINAVFAYGGKTTAFSGEAEFEVEI